MAETEHELKYEISPQDFLRLPALLPPAGPEVELLNTYFSVPGEVGRRDWVLRLREQSGSPPELTLKVGRQVAPGDFRSVEYTCPAPSGFPSDWEHLEPVQVFRREISGGRLSVQGAVVTRRCPRRGPFPPERVWEFDACALPDGSQVFELEVECPTDSTWTEEQGRAYRIKVERWLADHGATFAPSRQTKYGRFLEACRRAASLAEG